MCGRFAIIPYGTLGNPPLSRASALLTSFDLEVALILTPNFVFIHQPKTGGTFVTDVLSDLLGPPKHTFDGDTKIAFFNKHGTCREIPETHRELPICASLRNPYERYVSQYMFAWWKQELPPWIEIDAVLAHFPHFPELSFEEFVSGSEILLQFFRNDALAEAGGWDCNRNSLSDSSFASLRFFRQSTISILPSVDMCMICIQLRF